MRETKDQKIVRLERKIKELENCIKEQKAGNRQFKKELKQSLNISDALTSHQSDLIY